MLFLRRRWIAGHLLVLFFAGSFVALGIWQLARRHQKQEKVAANEAAYAAPAPDVTTVQGRAPATNERAQASGTFDTGHEVLLRNRIHDSNDGDDVLTPLRLDDGTAVLVDRGWVFDERGNSAVLPKPPTGHVVARGWLRPSRTLSAQDTVEREGAILSLPRVDVARIQREVPYQLRPVWIEAQAILPSPGADAPKLPQPPPPDPVNHFEYAVEWFALALVPIIGWPIVLTQIARRRQKTAPAAGAETAIG